MRRKPDVPNAWERNKEIFGMSRESSWKRTEEVQIDLLDLLHRLCGQWRRIAVCALAAAVLAGAGSYVMSKNGTAEDTLETADDAEPEAVPLTQEERMQGVEAARQLAQETKELELYMADSLLMQMDPYHKNTVQLLFRVEGTTGWTMQKIVEKYLNFLANDAALDAIQKADSEMEGIEKCYLSELFWASQKTSGTYLDGEGDTLSGVLLLVEATGLDAEMAANLAADIKAALEAYQATVKEECGSHALALLSSGEKERADSTLLTQQREKRTLLATNRSNLKAMVDAFDDEQKAMYAASGNENPGSQIAESAKDGLEGEEAAGTVAAEGLPEPSAAAAEGLPEPETAEVPKEVQGSVSILYVLLGFLGGAFAYSVAYAGWYLMSDTVKSAGEFRSYYTFPFYGSIDLSGRTAKNNIGKRNGGKGSTGKDYAGQEASGNGMAQVLNRVRLSCKKQDVPGFCLATDFSLNEKEKACMDAVVSQLQEWGYDVVLAENISGSIAMWDILAETGAVLMVCRLGRTTHRMVDDAMEFYQESGVTVLGAAALE